MHKALATILATAVMTATFAAPTADAAPTQKQKQKQQPGERSDASPSRDGRVLGRPRTCGYDHIRYIGDGTPIGPYCH
jgi:Ni/Co efflux regulator RcnB